MDAKDRRLFDRMLKIHTIYKDKPDILYKVSEKKVKNLIKKKSP